MRFYMNEPAKVMQSPRRCINQCAALVQISMRPAIAVHSTRSNLSRAAPYCDLHPMKRFTFTCVISFCVPLHNAISAARMILGWRQINIFSLHLATNFNLREECRIIAHWSDLRNQIKIHWKYSWNAPSKASLRERRSWCKRHKEMLFRLSETWKRQKLMMLVNVSHHSLV